MTTTERAVLSGELSDFRAEVLAEFRAVREEQKAINSRLDRWDGALTFIKAGVGFLGVGGLGLILAALLEVSGHAL